MIDLLCKLSICLLIAQKKIAAPYGPKVTITFVSILLH